MWRTALTMSSSNEEDCKLNKVSRITHHKTPYDADAHMQTTCKPVLCNKCDEVLLIFCSSHGDSMNSLFFQNGEMESSGVKTWRLVLTGGPCGGKTTAQNRLATFFVCNLGLS